MNFKNGIASLVLAFAGMLSVAQAEQKNSTADTVKIQGQVPEGWEVVQLVNVAPIAKWVETKDGGKKKVFVKPFGLQPIADKGSAPAGSNPLGGGSGQKLEEAVEGQNMNLAQSQEEFSVLLNRLRALLGSLPETTANQ